MNRKFLYGLAVLAIAVVAAFNMNLSSKGDGLSDISLANVEALARNEDDAGTKYYQHHCGSKPGIQCQSQLVGGTECTKKSSCP